MDITVLIHSSKTMRSPIATSSATTPLLMGKVRPLAAYLQTLGTDQLQTAMSISEPLSRKVHTTLASWSAEPNQQSLAVDSFVGDIYSGLRASTLSADDRDYAQHSLRILSGLYGILRPYDGVCPYRLEMGYRLPDKSFGNLYEYWGSDIAKTLPKEGMVVNLSAAEYTKTVVPYIDSARVVAPRFLTINPKTGEPSQVIVHTKIARGAFARWLMVGRINSSDAMPQFDDLNYRYDAALSTPSEPTFVCKTFGGIGLSMRLQKT
ncbi:MAG TPA: YaaA family protein [Verrucomicrobiae bacterium]|nr:YaaA family protein [Verrucomicrobiae bacterium]